MRTVLSVLASALVAVSAHAADIVTPIYASPPKFFVSGGEAKGLCIDVLKAIEKIAPDVRFVVQRGVPLKRVELGVRDGTYDLLLCATPTKERAAQLMVVDVPIYSSRDVLIVRADDPIKDATLDDIRKMKTGNVMLTYAGSGQHAWLSEQDGLMLDVPAPNPEANLMKLESNRGRFVFSSEAVGVSTMGQTKFAGKFRMLPTPVRTMGRYFYFSKKTPPDVVRSVEAALRKLAASGELKKIADRYLADLAAK